VDAVSGGEAGLRGLMGVAFAGGEPALPDLDSVLADVELLGGRMRRRQRIRNGIAAAALCVAGFGMVAGIAAIAHSTSSSTPLIPGGGGAAGTTDQVPQGPSAADTGP
jgi:hypothetical protein